MFSLKCGAPDAPSRIARSVPWWFFPAAWAVCATVLTIANL